MLIHRVPSPNKQWGGYPPQRVLWGWASSDRRKFSEIGTPGGADGGAILADRASAGGSAILSCRAARFVQKQALSGPRMREVAQAEVARRCQAIENKKKGGNCPQIAAFRTDGPARRVAGASSIGAPRHRGACPPSLRARDPDARRAHRNVISKIFSGLASESGLQGLNCSKPMEDQSGSVTNSGTGSGVRREQWVNSAANALVGLKIGGLGSASAHILDPGGTMTLGRGAGHVN